MSLTTRVGLLAGASALTLTGASFADNPTGNQSTDARIAELEAQVAQLTGANWMTEQRSDEIRSLVQDVLADADTRASLLQSGMSAGYDDGFVLGSADGGFMMRLNGQLQTRWIYNNQDLSPDDDDNRAGFENTRTKLVFSGTVGDGWSYEIQGNFSRDGGGNTLEDAWVMYDLGDGWNIYMGQGKIPFQREFLVDSMDQLAVERSNVSYLYGAARTQGVLVSYDSDQWRFMGSFNDGAAGANTTWSTYDTEWAFTGLAEILLSGNWDQFDDFSSPPGSEQGLMIGVAAHYQSEEYGTTTTSMESQPFLLMVDGSFEGDGFSAYAGFNYADADTGAAVGDNPWGLVVQGGFFLNDKWEAYIRYEWNDFDDSSIEDLSIITVGVNGYYSSNVKMTADVGFGLDEVTGASDITGWRDDAAGQDGQFVARAQLQLVF